MRGDGTVGLLSWAFSSPMRRGAVPVVGSSASRSIS